MKILLDVHKDVNTRLFTAALFPLANQAETTLNTLSMELDKTFLYIKVMEYCMTLQLLGIEISVSVGPRPSENNT